MLRLLRIFKEKKEELRSDRLEICISGSGGQGIILAGKVLADAFALYECKNVVQTQSYGPESRGGASKCEVVISEGEIFYPKTMDLDILLALTQEALDKNIGRLKKDGTLLADSFQVKNIPKRVKNSFALPLTQTATKLGNILAVNMIGLGALAAITKVVKLETLQQALKGRVKKKFLELDNKALIEGSGLGK